jgi:hypothetical protein
MAISTCTFGQDAFAQAGQRPHPGAQPRLGAIDPARFGEARAEPRVKTAIVARVRTARAVQSAHIRNLSSRGLMLSIGLPPMRGEGVEIVAHGQCLTGEVRWASEHAAGVALHQTIDVRAMILRASRAIAAAPPPRHKAKALPG